MKMKIKGDYFYVTEKQAQRIVRNALKSNWLLWIRTSAWGNRKQLSKSLLEEKFQKNADAISAIQRLIDNDEIKKLTKPMRRAQTKARNMSMPWFHEAIYFIFQKDVNELEAFLIKMKKELDEARKYARENYADWKKETKKKYPELYNEMYYPSVDVFVSKFNLIWGWQRISVPVPEETDSNINTISKEIADKENQKFQQLMEGVAEESIVMIRSAFMKILKSLRDKLKDPNAKFKDSTVEKPKQFLEMFKKVNIFGDQPFEDLTEDLKDILGGIYGEDLRDDKKYRKQMAEVLDDVVDIFEDLPTVKFDRAIKF